MVLSWHKGNLKYRLPVVGQTLKVCSRHQNEACGVTIEPETKWMPNSDFALKVMPQCKILGQYDLPNYFYSSSKLGKY